ncbi:MAG: glycoside hydrolase family 3 C-terminal domain-containing protein [Lachnospiraceae bacterium]|nr:glycoside hydrolase family 3 C-terminal domain-containing protein [Lachnospiraceae bacterium]
MNTIQKTFGKLIRKTIDSFMGSGLMQEETSSSGEKYITPGISERIRRAGAESCVLLKNDGVLPLDPKEEIAVFGRSQLDWFYVGYGSGGDVQAPYYVNFLDGLDNAGAAYNRTLAETYRAWTSDKKNEAFHGWWGHWPYSHPEMSLDPGLIKRTAASSKTAVVIIGRAAGEDRDNVLKPGSYYLTDAETAMLDAATEAFEKTVVILNTGSIIDMGWTEKYGKKLSALLIAWLGGMESGNAVCDVLFGKVTPCGRLPDTIARRFEDYPSSPHFGNAEYNDYAEDIFVGYRYFDRHPEKVLWPFGYGLSYTEFFLQPDRFSRGQVDITIKNTGAFPGKEVVQLFYRPPKEGLPKPERILAALAKTRELKPGESDSLTLAFEDKYLASYDESRHAFVLEAGCYEFFANNVPVGSFELSEELLVEQCSAICISSDELKARILENHPDEIPGTGRAGLSLKDVKEGRGTLDEFIAALSSEEMEGLSRGHGTINSWLGVPGNAGVLGGVLPSLIEKGVPPLSCCDGPAGLRMNRYCSLMPCGTALAATWNPELIEELHILIGKEMEHYGVDIHLAPGMNIHRNPLCGRNFEYYSEDPVLSGKIAAAAVRGIQSTGRASCPKHFACNNQEFKRNINDSRVSERALREIYLRNFEICIKEGRPLCIMSSYNKVNGVWSHYNYDLATTVLRNEWGFDGIVMTDWWMRKSKSPEFPDLKDNAYRVRAQVDVLMPGNMGHLSKQYKTDGTLLKTLGKKDGLTPGELERTARNVLSLILKLKYQ